MKFTRFVSLLAVAASLPVLASAAGSLAVGDTAGQSRTITDGVTTPVKSGDTIPGGTVLETNTDSSTELTLTNGVRVVLGPNTRLRVKNIETTSTAGLFVCELVLLRGNITGDATGASSASNLSIRTTAGVANVAGSTFSVDFSPSSQTTGVFTVSSLQGSASLLSVNSSGPVSIPAGFQGVSGASGTQVNPLSPLVASKAKAILSGSTIGVVRSIDKTTVTGSGLVISTSTTISINLSVISPNGEGHRGL